MSHFSALLQSTGDDTQISRPLGRRPPALFPPRCAVALLAALLLQACSTASDPAVVSAPKTAAVPSVVTIELPPDVDDITAKDSFSRQIRDAMSLVEQGELGQALYTLRNLRLRVVRGSDGWLDLTAAMMAVTVKAGELDQGIALAVEYERFAPDIVRVPKGHAPVVAFFNALRQKPLPVNTSKSLRQKLEIYAGAKVARNSERRNR